MFLDGLGCRYQLHNDFASLLTKGYPSRRIMPSLKYYQTGRGKARHTLIGHTGSRQPKQPIQFSDASVVGHVEKAQYEPVLFVDGMTIQILAQPLVHLKVCPAEQVDQEVAAEAAVGFVA